MLIVVPGDPIAKERPRFARKGNFVTTYSRQSKQEKEVLSICQEQVKEVLTGPLWVTITFYIRRPKGHYGTGKNAGVLKPNAPEYPTPRPDLDNYVKFYFDVLNEVAWEDDAQVCILSARKLYSDDNTPETYIEIKRARRIYE